MKTIMKAFLFRIEYIGLGAVVYLIIAASAIGLIDYSASVNAQLNPNTTNVLIITTKGSGGGTAISPLIKEATEL